jgi:hypothetical protein
MSTYLTSSLQGHERFKDIGDLGHVQTLERIVEESIADVCA